MGKRQDYDLKELKERQRQQNKQKAIKLGLDPEALTGKYPPKIRMYSKYERRTDTRTYGDRRKLYEGGWDVLYAELLEKTWKEKMDDWGKRPKAKLPKWFGERPGKKPGDPESLTTRTRDLLRLLRGLRKRRRRRRKRMKKRKRRRRKRRSNHAGSPKHQSDRIPPNHPDVFQQWTGRRRQNPTISSRQEKSCFRIIQKSKLRSTSLNNFMCFLMNSLLTVLEISISSIVSINFLNFVFCVIGTSSVNKAFHDVPKSAIKMINYA